MFQLTSAYFKWRHDTQHNGTKYNDIQQKNTTVSINTLPLF